MTTDKLHVWGYEQGCPSCDELKALLTLLKVPFEFHAIERECAARASLRDAGFKTVPQVFTPNGTSLGGFSELRRAGAAGIAYVQELIGSQRL